MILLTGASIYSQWYDVNHKDMTNCYGMTLVAKVILVARAQLCQYGMIALA